jgi:hypothetical protein
MKNLVLNQKDYWVLISLCGEVMIHHRGTESTEFHREKNNKYLIFSVSFSVSSVPLWYIFSSFPQ